MEYKPFGTTGLRVSPLGIGLAEIGFQLDSAAADHAGRVLNTALDLGINFVDTAGCYGVAEELMGKTIAGRRDDYVLSSKTGHMIGDCGADGWSRECIATSIDRSLKRMKTDHIDIMHLHSCSLDVLKRGEAIRALEDAREAGKIHFAAYSGDNEAVEWAAEIGSFAVLQTSFNLVDQRARKTLLDQVAKHNLGLIAKRPILNGTWRTAADPDPYKNGYGGEYFSRQKQMCEGRARFVDEPDDPILASLGYVFSHPEVGVAIVGSKNEKHVRANVAMLESMPLSSAFVDEVERRFDELGTHWRQQT